MTRVPGRFLPILAFLLISCGSSPPLEPEMTIDEAIARGDLAQVQLILEVDPEAVNAGTRPGMPPLSAAILRKKTDIALELIRAGADVNAVDSGERTPAHLAVERNLPELIAPLAEAGASLDEVDRVGWPPLHWAAAKDRLEVVQALIEAGADVQARTTRGGTVLHEAAASGRGEILKLFLELGVDPNEPAADGSLPLDVARNAQNEEAIRVLKNWTGESGAAPIVHTVFFKLKHASGSAAEEAFREESMKLATIPGVRDFAWLKETSPKNNFDYGLTMVFEGQKAYDSYNVHPVHVRYVEEVWIPNVTEFLEIDYLQPTPSAPN